jgi:hypothetical protein
MLIISKNSQILLPDYTSISVEHLSVGQNVLGFSHHKGTLLPAKVCEIFPVEKFHTPVEIVAYDKRCIIGERLYNRVLVYNDLFMDKLSIQQITHINFPSESLCVCFIGVETEYNNIFVNGILYDTTFSSSLL